MSGYQPPMNPGPVGGVEDPGKTMGIIGLILSFLGCLSPVGLIISIMARSKSKKAGHQNTLATVGIVVGLIVTVITIIGAIVMGVTLGAVFQKCAELGPGVHQQGGTTYTCS